MAGRLAGKTALITAAAAGIGRATALAFVREGATVVATDVDAAGLEALRQDEPRIQTARLDVLDAEQCAGIGARWPEINVLANVAGYVHHGTILDCSPEDWARSFDLNVNSMYRTIRSVLPRMLERGGGAIVNVSSVASSVKGIPNRSVYGATKAAVIGLTKSVAVDFISKGIRCNAICPGTVRSPSWEGRVDDLGKTVGGKDKAMELFVSRQPMGRVGEASEIAALALYLASDEAAFTTGTAIPIDGGWTL